MERLDQVAPEEMPELLRVASTLYARDRAEIERAAQRLELRKAAAEAGLPPEYLERAAFSLRNQRRHTARRRRWRRAGAALAAAAALWIGGLHFSSAPEPPPDTYLSYPGGAPYGGPGGYPGYSPPGYGPPAAVAAPPGPPGGPVDYGGYSAPPPDGSGGPLAGANLRGQAFPHANLSGQNLSQANLRGADITGANLRGADLTGSDLRGADLTGADLSGAELTDAVYDRFTRWPQGFNPAEHGAKHAPRGGRR